MRTRHPPLPMRRLGRWTRARVFLRSFLVQASWNYRTLIGSGFAFALVPAFREVFRGDDRAVDEAVRRHARLFNSHPYLSPVALGAVAVLEAEGEGAEVIERFKTALRGSLGTLGDRLIWAGWRPLCVLFALAVLLAGAAWWVGVLVFLALYNAGHIAVRVLGYQLGLREGLRIGEQIRSPGVMRVQRALPTLGSFLAGLLLPLVVAGPFVQGAALTEALGDRGRLPLVWLAAGAAGALVGLRFGARVRTPVVIALWIITLGGILAGMDGS